MLLWLYRKVPDIIAFPITIMVIVFIVASLWFSVSVGHALVHGTMAWRRQIMARLH